jgi:hypothetical protein
MRAAIMEKDYLDYSKETIGDAEKAIECIKAEVTSYRKNRIKANGLISNQKGLRCGRVESSSRYDPSDY